MSPKVIERKSFEPEFLHFSLFIESISRTKSMFVQFAMRDSSKNRHWIFTSESIQVILIELSLKNQEFKKKSIHRRASLHLSNTRLSIELQGSKFFGQAHD